MAERDTLERSANRMDLVSRWADDLAHEIKNPLHAMVINLELVKRRAGGGDPGPVVQRTEVVEEELHRVHQLVESLLRLVRPWPDQRMADPDRVFELLGPAVRARARVRKLEYRHEPGGAPVAMPPGHFGQAILNLVDNAIDATPGGGRLVTRCAVEGPRVRVTVADTGGGLPADLAARAHEPGVSSRSDRAGLGLAIADRLIREAGGDWSLEPAAEGTGTLATVLLPRSGSA